MPRRTTVTVSIEPPVTGIADHPDKRQSEKLAMLSAVYQLHSSALVSPIRMFSGKHIDVTISLTRKAVLRSLKLRSQIPLSSRMSKPVVSWITIADDLRLERPS